MYSVSKESYRKNDRAAQFASAGSSFNHFARRSKCSHMFSFYSVDAFGMLSGWANDMEALACKEKAQHLQAAGHFEAALPLMLESVAMRERSHTLCLSLTELGELYLDMLKFADAEAAARRVIREAMRYDTAQQTRIAEELIENIAQAKLVGLQHGSAVRLRGLARRPELNGKRGVVRGMCRSRHRYFVDVGASRYLMKRANFQLSTEDWLHGAVTDGVDGG